jgi:hypothetical protein
VANGEATGAPPGGHGGGILNAANLTLSGVTLSGNAAQLDGGGVANLGGALRLTNSKVTGNSAGNGGGAGGGASTSATPGGFGAGAGRRNGGGGGLGAGGAVFNHHGTVTMTNCTLTRNTAQGGDSGDNGAGEFGGDGERRPEL